MDKKAIIVNGLGKRYRIGERKRYKAIRDVLPGLAMAPFKKIGNLFKCIKNRSDEDTIWAIRDVSFEIRSGEVVGVIGRNGTGKSTLLKILSKITSPTEGEARVHGRIGSLLEVGTGFHPELTGRENIYMNGAILGMKKIEIKSKFDEIVSFAEVEKFLDTPVKRYSSGMQMRLAFAVAAHLESEILLVDEVLSVGDLAFQKKCLGKMGDVVKGGRTVLFVSHQMNSIRKLCNSCIWLDSGRLRMIDSAFKVIGSYETSLASNIVNNTDRQENACIHAQFLSWEICSPKSEQSNLLTTSGPVVFNIMIRVNEPILNGEHGIALHNSDNQLIWAWATSGLKIKPGIYKFVYTLPNLPLRPSVYSMHVTLYDEGNLLDSWFCVPELIIATSPLGHPLDEWSGIINIPCDFKFIEGKDYE